jgi:hypothetical protein
VSALEARSKRAQRGPAPRQHLQNPTPQHNPGNLGRAAWIDARGSVMGDREPETRP